MPDLVSVAYPVAHLKKPTFSGPSRVPWTKKKWLAKNAAYYTPNFEIDKVLPYDVTIRVKVMEDRNLQGDPRLGNFKVLFKQGKLKGQVITENDATARSRGFPARTLDRFWLVATKRRHIRGNKGPGDDEHANVYLEAKSGVAVLGNRIVAQVMASGGRGKPLQSKRKSIRA